MIYAFVAIALLSILSIILIAGIHALLTLMKRYDINTSSIGSINRELRNLRDYKHYCNIMSVYSEYNARNVKENAKNFLDLGGMLHDVGISSSTELIEFIENSRGFKTTLLDINPYASNAERKAVYRALSSVYHPDKKFGDEDIMKKLNAELDRSKRNTHD